MHCIKKICIILSFAINAQSLYSVTPFFYNRSQGENVAREMVGWERYINLCDTECFYGAFAITGEVSQTFNANNIAHIIFGNDIVDNNSNEPSQISCNPPCHANLRISGSQAATRTCHDWLGDYFGVAPDFESLISFNPIIRNFVADISAYFGLDNWVKGLYCKLDLPLTHTHSNLQFSENVLNRGIQSYSAGYFNGQGINANETGFLTHATDFFTGYASMTDMRPTFLDDNLLNVTFQKLRYSTWAPCNSCQGTTLTRFADIKTIIGWNFLCCDDYYVGVNARFIIPTGNRPEGLFLFEPLVGNGHHWELGAGICAHALLCQTDCAAVSFYFDGNVTHLFSTCQTRCFDLCGKPNSRYMLAEKLTENIPFNGLAGDPIQGDINPVNFTPSLLIFDNEFAPVANITTSNVSVSVPIQADLALKLAYQTSHFEWDFGYEFWIRSREKINHSSACFPQLDGKSWALKGDALVVGFDVSMFTIQGINLGATESQSTIHCGTNGFNANNPIANANAFTNPGIDNPQFAVSEIGNMIVFDPEGSSPQTRTSIQSIALKEADVNLCGNSKSFSHKLFTHLNYAWIERCNIPFIGIGASVECTHNNANLWAFWVKGGVSF